MWYHGTRYGACRLFPVLRTPFDARPRNVADRQIADAVLHWIQAREARHDDESAGRVIALWGDLALDVALARSSAETGGLFDIVDTGCWADAAREIRRRQG